ncbi:unnamed protein product [Cunninghamella blakesleeana]
MSNNLVVQYSEPISAYMSGLPNVNLAYVKHYAKKPEAIKATFKSLDANGFSLSYDTLEQQDLEITIPWPTTYSPPLTKREQIRPILEDMAKIAEEALGMPSSLNGPPPISALMKSMKAELQSETTEKKNNLYQHDEKNKKGIDKDQFFRADIHWQVLIIIGMSLTYYLTDPTIPENGPQWAIFLQKIQGGPYTLQWTWKIACALHIGEACIACGLCMYRGWYSFKNVAKWTFSTFLYGYASLNKLLKHDQLIKKID